MQFIFETSYVTSKNFYELSQLQRFQLGKTPKDSSFITLF